MSLPDLIEIVPLAKQVEARITVPGSKSITNRALILAALGQGETILESALWSEDTEVMVECLQELGFMVNVAADEREPCNRTITVYGKGGLVPPGGTPDQPLELFVGNAGTAARFLAAFVCLGHGAYRLHGVARMNERPQAALFESLRELGYRVESSNNRLPAIIHGAGPRPGKCRVSIEQSSQFASALMLSAGIGGWQVEVTGDDADEASYVAMTSKMIRSFPKIGGIFLIEPDASSGSYFLAVNKLGLPDYQVLEHSQRFGAEAEVTYSSEVSVANWPGSGWQIDEKFPEAVERLYLGKAISRAKDLGDSIMTAIVVAPLFDTPTLFTDLGRLRLQECERVIALRTELTKCGAKVLESGDTLQLFPSQLHGAEIETYNDHRMAMCFAILGLKVPGLKINNPRCVRKTFPDFFQKLAAASPKGLGAIVRDAESGQILGPEELFAA